MASGKLSPRQKMINMMYLVLIALLALNVSKEILKAFHLFEVSFENAKVSLDGKNKTVMDVFESNMQKQAEKTRPWKEKADLVRKTAKEFCDYIDGIRKELETGGGGRKPAEEGEDAKVLTELNTPDNMEKHANYFVNEGHGKELQDKVNATRDKMINVLNDPIVLKLNPSIIKNFQSSTPLRAEDPKAEGESKHTWVGMYLEHTPLAGVMTMLSKMQTDCKNLEADILNELLKQINATDFKFDNLQAFAMAPTSYLMVGEQYEADIILSAFNSKQDNKIFVNGQPIKVEGGVGKYKVNVGDGESKYKGEIQVEGADGLKKYPFEGTYMGFKGSATISADKMNVLYCGLQNPVSVSVPGFPIENVSVTASGVTLTPVPGQKGKYNATVSTANIPTGATIIANVKMKDGSVKKMGEMKFRVKNLPKPTALFGGLGSGDANTAQVSAAKFLTAGLGPEFVFEGVNFTVTKYTLAYQPRRGDVVIFPPQTGNTLTPQMTSQLSKAKKGDMISIFGLEATGPNGPVKLPSSITIAIK